MASSVSAGFGRCSKTSKAETIPISVSSAPPKPVHVERENVLVVSVVIPAAVTHQPREHRHPAVVVDTFTFPGHGESFQADICSAWSTALGGPASVDARLQAASV